MGIDTRIYIKTGLSAEESNIIFFGSEWERYSLVPAEEGEEIFGPGIYRVIGTGRYWYPGVFCYSFIPTITLLLHLYTHPGVEKVWYGNDHSPHFEEITDETIINWIQSIIEN